MSTVFNLSEDSEYHSQRNNKFFPFSTCNTTSAIMALKSSQIPFGYASDMQPEDYLTSILRSDEAYVLMREKYTWAIPGGYEPNEVHGMLEWGINKMVGKKVDRFSTNNTLQELVYYLIRGRASIINGRFTKYGHMVVLVGFETYQKDADRIPELKYVDLNEIKHYIIDDPYGNYHTDYKDVKGNNVIVTPEDFNYVTKTYNNIEKKWAHIFDPLGWE